MSEMCKVGVAVLLFRCGSLLVGQRIGSYGGGEWSVPGGKLDQRKGESPAECAARELREETGIVAELQMLPFATWDGGHPDWPDYVTLWAVGSVPQYVEAEVLEPEKCAEWRWCLGQESLPDPLFRCLKTATDAGLITMAVETSDAVMDFAAKVLGGSR